MFDFIDVLKTLASILITNSHYGNIWPISVLATGGLLGDVMFFAVSGFCLVYIKQSFCQWYLKRIFRIYPGIWLVNVIALLVGFYTVSSVGDFVQLFVYPTYYHFIASIMLIYIIYYILIWIHRRYAVKLIWIMIGVFVIYFLCYIFLFDYSYYHIDVVEEYMVRFLYMESMLLGALFREKLDENRLGIKIGRIERMAILFIMLIFYLFSKFIFSYNEMLSILQIFNQIILFLLLVCIMRELCIWELTKKKKLESFVTGRIIRYISKITLEIYIVQYLVYYLTPELIFPANFIVVTGGILVFAGMINFVSGYLTKRIFKWMRWQE